MNIRLRLLVSAAGADAEQQASLAGSMREFLVVQGIDAQAYAGPPDATHHGAGGPVMLVVVLDESAASLRSALSAASAWLQRAGSRTLRAELDGETLELKTGEPDQERLIEWFVSLNAGDAGPVRSFSVTRGLPGSLRGFGADEAVSSSVLPAEPTTADVNVAADMPSRLQVGQVATVVCHVSRAEIDRWAERSRAQGRIAADPSRRIMLELVPRANVEVAGDDRAEISVPGEGETSDAYFDVRPTQAGTCQVWVVVRQGPVPLLTLRLSAPADLEPQTVPAARHPVQATVAVGEATGLEDATWLSVTEMDRGPDTVYRFELRSTTLKTLGRFESPPLRHRAEYVANLYRQIENRWLTSAGDVEAFGEELREFGGGLLSQLFPEKLQKVMWDLRDRLQDLIVLSPEPFIPWELVHLKEPGGTLPDESRFLAETGLVRWLYTGDNAYPPQTLRARPGRVRVLCPDYPDPELRLATTRQEAEFLTTRLGASPVTPNEREVRALLQDGGFDILHFAGHGQADAGDIANAKILLEGRRENGVYVPATLSATTVDQRARLAGPDGSKPLVVLNACQAGRLGQQMSSLGGFAQAFLERGAGAFVSSMWSVGDEPASTFVTAFYTELLDQQPISVAARRARAQARQAGDGTWLAYAVYGHPQARLLRPGRA
jgi:CHAT domain-containing protein